MMLHSERSFCILMVILTYERRYRSNPVAPGFIPGRRM
jgi:hypothetical protein